MKNTVTKFLVSFSGQIEHILFPAGIFDERLYIQYEFVWGPDWDPISGLSEGASQMACSGSDPERVVFNLPVEMTFGSTNISGWPQLVVTVRAQNPIGGDSLRGYGLIQLPLAAGSHQLVAPLLRPRPATLLGEWVSWLTGRYPELADPKMLAHGKENYQWSWSYDGDGDGGSLLSSLKIAALAMRLHRVLLMAMRQHWIMEHIHVLRTESYGSVTSRFTMVSQELRKLGYDSQPAASVPDTGNDRQS